MARSARHILEPARGPPRRATRARERDFVTASALGAPRVSSLVLIPRSPRASPFPHSRSFAHVPSTLPPRRRPSLSSAPSPPLPRRRHRRKREPNFFPSRRFFPSPARHVSSHPRDVQEGLTTPRRHRSGCRPGCRPGYLIPGPPIPGFPIPGSVVGDVVGESHASPVSSRRRRNRRSTNRRRRFLLRGDKRVRVGERRRGWSITNARNGLRYPRRRSVPSLEVRGSGLAVAVGHRRGIGRRDRSALFFGEDFRRELALRLGLAFRTLGR